MAKRSFWENLGRFAGYGLRKAREAGAELEEQAEGRIDLVKAREARDEACLKLGRIVADLAAEKKPVDVGDPAVSELLEQIREADAFIAAREAESGSDRGKGEDGPRRLAAPPEPPPEGGAPEG